MNPSWVRTMSVPQTATQVLFGTLTPRISSRYCGQSKTTSMGITPSRTMRQSL